jgi:hypothetical protein
LKGGSYYRPSGSGWYFRHCIELRNHNKYVRNYICSDRLHVARECAAKLAIVKQVNFVTNSVRYLLFDAGYDRAGTVGFRCVADASNGEANLLQQQ